MRIPGLKRATLFHRWLRGRLVGQALILGYHRITQYERDPYGTCVVPQHFAEQLAALCQMAQPIPLHSLIESMRDNNLPERAVVVTIDDGYADALYQAKPLLEYYQVPATVFVTTGYQGCQFWWDVLVKILTIPTPLPAHFDAPLLDSIGVWPGIDTPAARKQLLWSLYNHMLSLASQEQQELLAQLQMWLGITAEKEVGEGRSLTSAELLDLVSSELITIGGHTVTHPHLANLSRDSQKLEIKECKSYLEQISGKNSVTSFSYPNGSLSQTTLSLVRESGFQCACASHHDIVHQNSDPFCLPRFWIPDWNGAQFSRWLQRWLPN